MVVPRGTWGGRKAWLYLREIFMRLKFQYLDGKIGINKTIIRKWIRIYTYFFCQNFVKISIFPQNLRLPCHKDTPEVVEGAVLCLQYFSLRETGPVLSLMTCSTNLNKACYGLVFPILFCPKALSALRSIGSIFRYSCHSIVNWIIVFYFYLRLQRLKKLLIIMIYPTDAGLLFLNVISDPLSIIQFIFVFENRSYLPIMLPF